MNRADSFLRVVDRLYAAAMEPAEWQPALESVTDLLQAGHTILALGGEGGAGLAVGARVDERDLSRLLSATAEGRMGPLDFGRLPVGAVVMRRTILPDREFLESDYYNDVIRPLNGFHSAFFRQELTSRTGFALAVCRPRYADDFAVGDRTILQGLLPHFTHAVELHNRLRISEQRSESLTRLLDSLDTGVILTDAAARPLLMNERAEQILREADGLAVTATGLAAATPLATRRLREAIATAGTSGNDIDGSQRAADKPAFDRSGRISLMRPSFRRPLHLRLLPIWRLGAENFGAPAPAVAVFVDEPSAPAIVDRTAVADVFRLTRREAEIASLLGEGRTLREIALELGLGIGTVRNHLKRAFEKTGTHNQAALVAAVSRFTRLRVRPPGR